MSTQQNRGRSDIALVVTIVLGLLIGFLIKRVHIGLLIGIGLGLITSVLLKRRSK
ncbi:MAG TPA: hypothetical protein VI548_12535 [Chitinophagaceae bacterium]|nr:hypothetical protein [Chitinophagaceae bacterium]